FLHRPPSQFGREAEHSRLARNIVGSASMHASTLDVGWRSWRIDSSLLVLMSKWWLRQSGKTPQPGALYCTSSLGYSRGAVPSLHRQNELLYQARDAEGEAHIGCGVPSR